MPHSACSAAVSCRPLDRATDALRPHAHATSGHPDPFSVRGRGDEARAGTGGVVQVESEVAEQRGQPADLPLQLGGQRTAPACQRRSTALRHALRGTAPWRILGVVQGVVLVGRGHGCQRTSRRTAHWAPPNMPFASGRGTGVGTRLPDPAGLLGLEVRLSSTTRMPGHRRPRRAARNDWLDGLLLRLRARPGSALGFIRGKEGRQRVLPAVPLGSRRFIQARKHHVPGPGQHREGVTVHQVRRAKRHRCIE